MQDCNLTTSDQPSVDVGGNSRQLIRNYNTQFGQITATNPFSYRTLELGLRLTF